jgi:SAM-dependent methyltransferase
MLSVARWRGPAGDARLEWLVADAGAVPLPEGGVDVALSAFMLQLVEDRPAVLAEIHRVLRPAGLLGLVTWLADDLVMAPDAEFDEAVYDLRLEDPAAEDAEPVADIASPDILRADLAAAAFEAIEVDVDELVFGWSRQGYLEFKEAYDEWDLFESLPAADRLRLRERVSERWAALPEPAFTLRAPLVVATARR